MTLKSDSEGWGGLWRRWLPAVMAALGLGILAFAGMTGCAAEVATDEPAAGANSVAGKPLLATARGEVVANELIVKMATDVGLGDARAIAASMDAELVWFSPRTMAAVFRFADSSAVDAALLLARGHHDVAWTGRNYVVRGTGISTSPGPIDLQWNLRAMRLSPERSWGSALGIRVAVLDSGVAYENHNDASGDYALAPDLAGVDFAAGYDFVNDDAHPNDDQGHGTHVTGVIAASDGILAMAPGAEILPVKVLDASNRGTELALTEGIYYAVDNGAHVINMSLAFPPSYYPSPLLQSAIDYAVASGVVLVAASGNHGAGVVAYPAAFREVIAVGASELTDDFEARGRDPWTAAHRYLTGTSYSNAGFGVDIAAPAGNIEADIDGDGNPEAILAQTFAGDTEAFDYYFYAGTSQAAAQVSGIAAVMLAENHELGGKHIRNVMGETARRADPRALLDETVGRGYLHGKLATRVASKRRATRDRLDSFAGLRVNIRRAADGSRYAEAVVEIADERGEPIKRATVYGTFSGNAAGSVSGRTDRDGVVTFTSDALHGDEVIAGFQVDAVSRRGTVDRPRGFVRVDSCSLELLADFATGSGISTSPGPITLRFASSPPSSAQTVMLMNYAWSGAVAPMAVAVDEAWYQAEFAGAELSIVEAYGSGISTSPLIIDPQRSFHPMVAQSWQPDVSSAACVNLVLRTFSGSVDTEFSPLVPDPLSCKGRSCGGIDVVLLDMWQAWFYGINTSPLWEPSLRVGPQLFAHLEELVQAYSLFGSVARSFPIGDLGGVLDAAGIGLAPLGGITSNAGTGIEAMNQ